PTVKRYVMKSVPEGTTRVAMLRNGEADIAYALDGEDALNVKRDPRLQLVPSKHASIYWIEFADQWDPKSPWHDKRVRLAANYAAYSWLQWATRARRPAAWKRSCTPRAAAPTAATRTSTICSTSRRASATAASAKRCCIASSSCRSTG